MDSRSQRPRGLRRRSGAARLLDCGFESHRRHGCLCSECCVLSGRGLCDELITRPEESYRLWCVVVCDLETSIMRRTWPTGELLRQKHTHKRLDTSSNKILQQTLTSVLVKHLCTGREVFSNIHCY